MGSPTSQAALLAMENHLRLGLADVESGLQKIRHALTLTLPDVQSSSGSTADTASGSNSELECVRRTAVLNGLAPLVQQMQDLMSEAHGVGHTSEYSLFR